MSKKIAFLCAAFVVAMGSANSTPVKPHGEYVSPLSLKDCVYDELNKRHICKDLTPDPDKNT